MTASAYSISDTVRLTRQLAREIGCNAPINVCCLAETQSVIERIQSALANNAGIVPQCHICASCCFQDPNKSPCGVTPDLFIVSSSLSKFESVVARCAELSIPIIIFEAKDHEIILKYTSANGEAELHVKLCGAAEDNSMLGNSIKRILRSCALLLC